MFKLLNRYKKGVSPVIAVVLLIALTVAAAAVIWQITQNNLTETGTLTKKSDTTAVTGGTTLTVNIVLTASHDGTISQVTVADDTPTTQTDSTTWTLEKGDNSETFTFTGTFSSTSTYELQISWKIDGEDETNIATIEVTAS
ncbi:MAG: archaellin/type IV pilin N-terminal domain-containing protein [Candidatus Kariarchaeaceae archaeon]|jgi:flagellin-like protein